MNESEETEETRKGFFRKKQQKNNKKCTPPPSNLPELSFLYTTHHLVLFYISTMYHQNILKDILVTEQRQEIKFTHKKGR